MIIREGLRRMLAEQEDVFYYLTLMNENYPHPAMPEGAEEGILRGMYLLAERPRATGRGSSCWARARSCARCEAAAELLRDDFGRRGRRLERHELHRAAARRAWRPSAGTCCTRARSRGARSSRSRWRAATGR